MGLTENVVSPQKFVAESRKSLIHMTESAQWGANAVELQTS
jgi:hypothetical protein